ncbi:rhomboid family domain-containing protein [Ditylenchus destructor]|nr:rhomboid family domain-containing protein [Ditylenchus destructor]
MIIFLLLLQFGIHIIRLANGSCYSSETSGQRCIRTWYHSQWGQKSNLFRFWASKAGVDFKFDPHCYAVILDPRYPQSVINEEFLFFAHMSPLHRLMYSSIKCYNEEIVRGVCKNKRADPIFAFKCYDECDDVHRFDLDELDMAYHVFFDYIKNKRHGRGRDLVRYWNLDYYNDIDFFCSDSMPDYGKGRRAPDHFTLRRFLTYALFHISLRELVYTAIWQILVGTWLEMRYGPFYVLTLYIVGAFTGFLDIGPMWSIVYDVGPMWSVLAMSISLVIEVFLNAHYWRNKLAFRWYALLGLICGILIFMLLAAIGNSWIYTRFRTDADYHKQHVLATPFLSRSCTKMLMVAIFFWPISSVILLKGNIGRIKAKIVESLSNIWVDFVLCCWGRNLWIHRTSCECFYCKRNTNNHLRGRQKLIENKAKAQAESAVSDLLETLAGFGWLICSVGLVWIYFTIWGAVREWSVCSVVLVWLWSRRSTPENKPPNVRRTRAKTPSVIPSNQSESENSSGENSTDVKTARQNKADEMLANSSLAAAQDEAEAKELAKRRSDLKAKMKLDNAAEALYKFSDRQFSDRLFSDWTILRPVNSPTGQLSDRSIVRPVTSPTVEILLKLTEFGRIFLHPGVFDTAEHESEITVLDPAIKAQIQKEIDENDEKRKELLASVKKHRGDIDRTIRQLDH